MCGHPAPDGVLTVPAWPPGGLLATGGFPGAPGIWAASSARGKQGHAHVPSEALLRFGVANHQKVLGVPLTALVTGHCRGQGCRLSLLPKAPEAGLSFSSLRAGGRPAQLRIWRRHGGARRVAPAYPATNPALEQRGAAGGKERM